MRQINQEIVDFIVRALPEHPGDIAALTAERFNIHRRTALEYLRRLQREGSLSLAGRTRARRYELKLRAQGWWRKALERGAEHAIWAETVAPQVADLKDNVRAILRHGFEEVFANAALHSGADEANVLFERDAANVAVMVIDQGSGVFESVRQALGLPEPADAALELAKGRVGVRGSPGEGLRLAMGMFDELTLSSRGLTLTARTSGDHTRFELKPSGKAEGTGVRLSIAAASPRHIQFVLDRCADGRGVLPVSLILSAGDALVSRAQARRLLRGAERFSRLVVDFSSVNSIGPAFADELFRVYRQENPSVDLTAENASPEIQRAIAWAHRRG